MAWHQVVRCGSECSSNSGRNGKINPFEPVMLQEDILSHVTFRNSPTETQFEREWREKGTPEPSPEQQRRMQCIGNVTLFGNVLFPLQLWILELAGY